MNIFNEQDYPALSNSMEWGAVTSTFALTESFDVSKVSNVSIVPTVGDNYVIMQIHNVSQAQPCLLSPISHIPNLSGWSDMVKF